MGYKKKEPNRPLAPIDWKKVDTMMLAGSTGTEIAGSLGIHPETFYKRYKREHRIGFTGAVYSKKQGGYGNLKTRQYVSAMNGNTQMLKILGEEWLGQGKGTGDVDGDQARTFIGLAEKYTKLEAALLARGISLSDIQNEQSIPHQRCPGEEDQVPNELGAENPMGGEA